MATRITKKHGVIRTEYVPGKLAQLKNLSKYVSTKQVAFDMEEIFRAECNQYIPVNQGNIRDHGYHVTLSNNKTKPWYKLSYRNTKALPYVMYQYIGKIRRPNVPIFERNIEKFNPNPHSWVLRKARFKYKHIGWFTPKNRKTYETNLNFRRRPVNLPLKAAKGVRKVVHLTGYTNNKSAQPHWVEYTKSNGNFWQTQTRVYVETVYASVLSRMTADAQKNAQRNAVRQASRRNAKVKKDIVKILGYEPTSIKTRLRKKKGGGN